MVNEFINQSQSPNEAPIKTLAEGVWRTSRLVNTSKYWESGVLGEGIVAPAPLPESPALRISSIWLFLICILYNELVI